MNYSIVNISLKIKLIYYTEFKKSEITLQKAVEILKAHGPEITEEQAEIILEFMKKMREIAINQGIFMAKMHLEKRKTFHKH